MRRRRRTYGLVPGLLVATLLTGPASAARKERLALVRQDLPLPGSPSQVFSTDVNRDGVPDLAVVIAYSERHQIGVDRIDGMVQFTEVIPAIFDHRELRVFPGKGDGTYREDAWALDLPFTVLSMEPGPDGESIVAVTDEGLSEVVLEMPGEEAPVLSLRPLIRDRPVLAGSGAFQPRLRVVRDLDGDGVGDILFPSLEGPKVYLTRDGKIDPEPVQSIPIPGERRPGSRSLSRIYPYPEVEYLNGDDLPDLVYRQQVGGAHRLHVLVGAGGGRFEPIRSEPEDCWDDGADLRVRPGGAGAAEGGKPPYPWLRRLRSLKDLDGDRLAEAVTVLEKEREGGIRAELKDAKKPVQKIRFHRLDRDLRIDPDPYLEMTGTGHLMEADAEEIPFSLDVFQDLDHDGRMDMVLVTLDFSVFQVFKIMATKSISMGLDFHVWRQEQNGTFREVKGLDLSEKLKFNLNDLKFGRFAEFGGDFDGDGIQDFVHLGRGKKVTIHRGRPGCVYPPAPDLVLRLDRELPHLGLVKIEDVNGDGLSDIRITRPQPWNDAETSSPVTLELYLSGGAP